MPRRVSLRDRNARQAEAQLSPSEMGRPGPTWEGEEAGVPPDTPATVLQMLQRLCGRVQEEVRALRLCPLEPVQDELLYARDLIKDAKNSRAVSVLQPRPPLTVWRAQEGHVPTQEHPPPAPCIYLPSPGPPRDPARPNSGFLIRPCSFSSCFPASTSWATCWPTTGLCGRGWSQWPVRCPRLWTRSCRQVPGEEPSADQGP